MDPSLHGLLGAELGVDVLVAHLRAVQQHFPKLSAELRGVALAATYAQLLKQPLDSLKQNAVLKNEQCFAVASAAAAGTQSGPRWAPHAVLGRDDEFGGLTFEQEARHLSSIDCVARIAQVYTDHFRVDRGTTVAPYFYYIGNFFDTPALQRLLRTLAPAPLPSFQAVREALTENYRGIHARGDKEQPTDEAAVAARATHIQLLRLLVRAAESHRNRIVNHPVGEEKGGEKEAEFNVGGLAVPCETAPGWVLAADAVVADNPALLRRIKPGVLRFVDVAVPLSLCSDLAIRSIGVVLREVPREVRQLAGDLAPNSSTARARELAQAQRRYNEFLRTSTCRRAILRLLATERSAGGDSGRGSQLLSRGELQVLEAVRVRFVSEILLSIVDSRRVAANGGGTDISSHAESPASAFDSTNHVIFVCVATHEPDQQQRQASHNHPASAAVVVPPHYLIAAELNKALASRIRNLAPLCCVLQSACDVSSSPAGAARHANNRHGDIDRRVHALLDAMGCADIQQQVQRQQPPRPARVAETVEARAASASAAEPVAVAAVAARCEVAEGRLVEVDDIARFGTCPLQRADVAWPVDDLASLVGVPDEATGLYVWGHLTPDTAASTVAIVFPACLAH